MQRGGGEVQWSGARRIALRSARCKLFVAILPPRLLTRRPNATVPNNPASTSKRNSRRPSSRPRPRARRDQTTSRAGGPPRLEARAQSSAPDKPANRCHPRRRRPELRRGRREPRPPTRAPRGDRSPSGGDGQPHENGRGGAEERRDGEGRHQIRIGFGVEIDGGGRAPRDLEAAVRRADRDSRRRERREATFARRRAPAETDRATEDRGDAGEEERVRSVGARANAGRAQRPVRISRPPALRVAPTSPRLRSRRGPRALHRGSRYLGSPRTNPTIGRPRSSVRRAGNRR